MEQAEVVPHRTRSPDFVLQEYPQLLQSGGMVSSEVVAALRLHTVLQLLRFTSAKLLTDLLQPANIIVYVLQVIFCH
jgi:hypothetical protein